MRFVNACQQASEAFNSYIDLGVLNKESVLKPIDKSVAVVTKGYVISYSCRKLVSQ